VTPIHLDLTAYALLPSLTDAVRAWDIFS